LPEEKMEKTSYLATDVNLTPTEERVRNGQISLFSLSTLNGIIYEEIKKELSSPKNKRVYKQMLLDSSVATPYSLVELMVSRVPWKVVCDKEASEEEKTRAKMLNYMIKSLRRPWREYIVEMISYPIYGYWVGEKIFKNIKTPYGSFMGLNDIKTISQDTVEKWHFDTDSGNNIGLRQETSLINSAVSQTKGPNFVDIPKIKYLHLRNSAKRDNPEGRSLLNSCYLDWKYKALLEEFQTIGAIKDLGGIPIFEVSAEKLVEAANDPDSDSGQLVTQLKKTGQALHSGDLSFGIVPIDYDDQGNSLYKFSLKGIEGKGKQVDTLSIIKYHSNKILMSFFADVLSLGSDGSGSFALSDSKMTLLELANENHLTVIKEALNHDLMSHIYKKNGWDYDPTSSCRFEFDNLNDNDLEIVGGYLQKIMAVGGIRPSETLENHLLDKLDIEPYDDKTKFIETETQSKSGEGLKEGLSNGTGTSTAKGGNRSTANVSKETT